MFEKRCDAGRKRVGPADPAKLCWCLPVIQGGIITAVRQMISNVLVPPSGCLSLELAGRRRSAIIQSGSSS